MKENDDKATILNNSEKLVLAILVSGLIIGLLVESTG